MGELEGATIDKRAPSSGVAEQYQGYECGLCFSSVQLERMYVLDDCSHRFCKSCLSNYLSPKLRSLPEAASATLTDAFGHLQCATHSVEQKKLAEISSNFRFQSSRIVPALSKQNTAPFFCKCGRQLSRRDLERLASSSSLFGYDKWLCAKGGVLDSLFGVPLTEGGNPCPKPGCAGQTVDPQGLETAHLSELRALARIFGVPTAVEKTFLAKKLTECLSKEGHEHPLGAVCPSCSSYVCKACGAMKIEGQEPLSPLCRNLQCYKIYSCLVHLETAMEESSVAGVPSSKSPAPQKRGRNHVKPQPRYSGNVWAAGTGFGGIEHQDYISFSFHNISSHQITDCVQKARNTEAKIDAEIGGALTSMADILGARGENEWGNELVPLSSATSALLCTRESLRLVLGRLVSNDSLMDICNRKELYLNLLAFLRAVGAREDLLPVLCTGSSAAAVSESDRKGKAREGAVCLGAEESILDLLQKLQLQGNVMLQSAQNGIGDDDGNVDQDLGLVFTLCDCVDLLQSSVANWKATQGRLLDEGEGAMEAGERSGAVVLLSNSRKGRGMKRKGRKEAAEAAEAAKRQEHDAEVAAYKSALRPLQFSQVAMDQHYFKKNTEAPGTAIDSSGAHHQKRMLRLSKEVGSLATCLPLEWGSSIYLRVADNRMDLLRALIVGPEGTPYQNGLFFFDIYLPPDYPQVPPQVNLLTTGGGRVRFNPNLYNCGKVCLSLLGTWPGPSWLPGQSTLLQVLVSIQSLILVPDPFFNEPGFESLGRDCSQAASYNRDQRFNTLQYALLPALKNPPRLFEDVTAAHCKAKRVEIQEQCESWQQMANGQHAMSMVGIVAEINAELGKL